MGPRHRQCDLARGRTPRGGFTLLECMIALLLVSTALVVVVESQSFAVTAQERAHRINTATTLARGIMADLELRMEKEGFGTAAVKEDGDFNDDVFRNGFEDYRWEYEVEEVEVELPNLDMVLGLLGGGAGDAAEEAGIQTGGGQPAAAAELGLLESLGMDSSFLSDQLATVLREARVRVCYPDGYGEYGKIAENCVELISHLVNPTGRVIDNESETGETSLGSPSVAPAIPGVR